MPPAIPFIAIAASAVVATSGFTAFVTFLLQAAIAIAAAALTKLTTKKPSFEQTFTDRHLTATQAIAPRVVIYGTTRAGGVYTFIHTTGPKNEFLNLLITLTGHEIESIEKMYFDGLEIPFGADGNAITGAGNNEAGKYVGFVKAFFKLGSKNQTAHAELIAAAEGKWTNQHRQAGCASAYVQLKFDVDTFPTGIPNISFLIKGNNQVLDVRTGQRGWTDNAALCTADYLSNDDYGLGSEYDTEIIKADLIEAANICDEPVFTRSGNEKRYTVNGTFETSTIPFTILQNLAGAMAGSVISQGSLWRVRAGAYRQPELHLTEGDLAGPISVQKLISRSSSFNGIRGTFISPVNDWQPDDFPAVSDPIWVAEDNGQKVWRDTVLNFTTSPYAAQRLSRIQLEQTRRQISVQLIAKSVAWQIIPYDTIQLTVPRYGWDKKTFVVKTINTDASSADGALVIDLELRETDPNVYLWTTANEKPYNPAPTTLLPDALAVKRPTFMLSDKVVFSGGVPVTNMVVIGMPSPDVFASEYEVQYKKVADEDWIIGGRGSTPRFEIPNVEDDVFYNVRLRAYNALGQKSLWRNTAAYQIIGRKAKPEDVKDFRISILNENAYLSWFPVSDGDLSFYRIKHSPAVVGATWTNAVALVERVGKPATSVSVPAIKGTYLIKAFDFGGRESVNEGVIVNSVDGLNSLNAVETQNEEPSFLGDTDMTQIVSDHLRLSTPNDITDIYALADIYAVRDVFAGEGTSIAFVDSGSYDFAAPVDLGKVYTSRVSSIVEVGGLNANSDVFALEDVFSVPDLFFGVPASWDFLLQIRTTLDDPADDPTWTEFKTFVIGDYVARGYDFRCVLKSFEFGVTPIVTKLQVQIDMPDRILAGEDINVPLAGLTVSFTPSYRSLKGLVITGQGLATGDYYRISQKSEAGFHIEYFDKIGNPVVKSVDYVASGFGRVV